MLSVDHVVPGAEARRLEIPIDLYEDAINLALCCLSCNGFGNRYKCTTERQAISSIETFCELRDQCFRERFGLLAQRRLLELDMFRQSPWTIGSGLD